MNEGHKEHRSGRQAILVLGMHRSGTSALSRILNLLGCDLPKTLMDGASSNVHGHWESAAAMNLNDAVLASGGSAWDDWLAFDPAWYQSSGADDFLRRGIDVIREEYGNSGLFVLKDPRNCRLLPFWLEVLGSEDIEPLISIPIRNPIEVAESLEKRNDMHLDVGLLLWLRHVLDAEADSRGQKRVFSAYEDLLRNWPETIQRMQTGLGVAWPRSPTLAAGEVKGFLDPGSRHHVHSAQALLDAGVSHWVRSVYAIMLRWSEDGENPADHEALDRVRREFDTAGPAFADLVRVFRQERRALREVRESIDRSAATDGQAVRDDEESRHEDRERIKFQENKIRVLEEESRDLRDNFDRVLKDIENTRRGHDEILLQSENRSKALERLQQEVTRSRADLERIHAELGAQKAEADWRSRQAKALQEELKAVSALLAESRTQSSEAKEQLDAALEKQRELAEQVERAQAYRATLTRNFEMVEEKSRQLESERALAESQGVLAATKLDDLTRQMQALTRSSADAEARARREEEKALGEAANARREAEKMEWLIRVNALLTHSPAWWTLMPAAWRQQQEHALLAENALFDASAYLRQNPDVAAAKLDPLRHYLMHGIREGRSFSGDDAAPATQV